jgi:pyruvate kinase
MGAAARPFLLDYTKIIATVGPASSSVDTLRQMFQAGADCCRVNFSHGDGTTLAPILDAVREAARLEGLPIALLADIQGPKLRVGKVRDEGILLVEGARFTLTRAPVLGSESSVESQYHGLADDVEPGARVLLADGIIELEVESVRDGDVHCRVTAGGRLFSNKGINLPGRTIGIGTLTEKDRTDLDFLSRSDVDLVAISFVRSPDDLRLARTLLGDARKIPVIAKLERFEAIRDLDAILEESDGIMVARGDLGVELPFERVPVLQKQILDRATQRGKWAIVATQMLASMVVNPRPSRAEASDVLNAVLDGADAVMLSEETAMGKHPVHVVRAMESLVRAAEEIRVRRDPMATRDEISGFAAGAAGAAVAAADRVGAKAIVTLAGSGLTALLVSKWRPALPVVALSATEGTLRRLNVLRGVRPVAIPGQADFEAQLSMADAFLLDTGWARSGDVVVVVSAIPLGTGKETNTIRFHRVRLPDGPSSWRA